MSLEENKDLIRRYFAAIDAACQSGNADILDEFLAPDFVEHNPFPGIPRPATAGSRPFSWSTRPLPAITWWRI
jgi:ketosteroid isomerase-like protein